MELRGNATNRWVPITFAAVVSEAVPMSSLLHLPESLQQMSVKLQVLNIKEDPIAGVFSWRIRLYDLSPFRTAPLGQ
jgi:hypothetical protein